METKGLAPLKMSGEHKGAGQPTSRAAQTKEGLEGTGARQLTPEQIHMVCIRREQEAG